MAVSGVTKIALEKPRTPGRYLPSNPGHDTAYNYWSTPLRSVSFSKYFRYKLECLINFFQILLCVLVKCGSFWNVQGEGGRVRREGWVVGYVGVKG